MYRQPLRSPHLHPHLHVRTIRHHHHHHLRRIITTYPRSSPESLNNLRLNSLNGVDPRPYHSSRDSLLHFFSTTASTSTSSKSAWVQQFNSNSDSNSIGESESDMPGNLGVYAPNVEGGEVDVGPGMVNRAGESRSPYVSHP